MASGQKPESLAFFGKHEIHKMLGGGKIRSSFEDRDAIRIHGGEILRQDKNHVCSSRNRHLREPVKINREGIGGFSQRHILGGGAGDTIELANVAANLGKNLP